MTSRFLCAATLLVALAGCEDYTRDRIARLDRKAGVRLGENKATPVQPGGPAEAPAPGARPFDGAGPGGLEAVSQNVLTTLAVRDAIAADPFLADDLGRIGIWVDSGTVRLTGQVGSAAERDAITDQVRQVPGVYRIENAIQVEPTLPDRGD